MSRIAFSVRVIPIYLLALVLTGIGVILVGERLSSAVLVPMVILLLVEFAALTTFRRVRMWSTLLLLALAPTVGALLWLMLPEASLGWPWAMTASIAAPLVGIPLGWLAGARLRRLGWIAWAVAWIYILTWIAWQMLVEGTWLRLYWGVAGLAIFFVLLVTWSASLSDQGSAEPEGSTASELYLIGMNLGIAALMVAGG